jgi:hypothetical protein
MGISAEVLENTLGAIKGRFAIDDPLLMIEVGSEGFKGFGFLEMTDPAGKHKIMRCEASFEKVKELTSE